MYKKCEELLKELEQEEKLKVWWDFEFPPKQQLKLRLKDMLEEQVDKKYYLSDEKANTFKPNNKKQGVIGTLKLGNFEINNRVYGVDDISFTLRGKQPDPKILIHNMQQIVKVRKYPVDIEKLKTTLRIAKLNVDLNNKQIAETLNVPQTQVEHYFRTDNSFAIPSPEIWFKLKEILKIQINDFDESIMTFEEKEGAYEKANRFYLDNGIAPTLTQQQEKIITNLRIRKLTPKECWRLMGFDDEDFEKVEKVNSNTQLYKQARKLNLCTSVRKNIRKLIKYGGII